MLDKVKLALRLTTNAYDAELNLLISAAYKDLGIAGISTLNKTDPLIERAVITYCRVNFGSPSDYDRIKRAYDEQKAQLQIASGYGLTGDAYDSCGCN